MIRTIIIIALCVGFHYVNAQNDSINRKDSEDKKQGHWIYYGADRPDQGYPNEGKIEEGRYVNDRKEGPWIKYWEDGKTMKLKGHYINSRPNGEYWKYHRNGILKEHGEFYKNQYNGSHEKYDSTGQLIYKSKYDEGKLIDTAFMYFANGCLEAIEIMDDKGVRLRSIMYSKDDCNKVLEDITQHPHGYIEPVTDFSFKKDSIVIRSIDYQENGTWRYYSNFVNEFADENICTDQGYLKKYNKDKELLFDGTCKNGRLTNGKLYFYDSDGILLRIEIWENGIFLRDGVL